MKIIAVEEHFLTENYRNFLRSRKEFPRRDIVEQGGGRFEREWWSPTNYKLINPDLPDKVYDLGEGRLRDMDESGIDMQVLSFSFPGIEPFNATDGTSMAKNINDELAEIVKRYPERFAGFAAIAPQDPDAAADELERAVKKLGFKGAMINGNIRGEYLDDEKYWVIFERAEKLGVPIYIHPRTPPEDMIKPYSVWPVLALAGWGFAAEAGLHAIRLICSGVFDEYPGLNIILGHLGEAIPFWMWRLDSQWPHDEMGIYSGPSRKLQKTPSQYFKDHFYVTTSGMFWQPVIQFVCSALGHDKVLFAADYPYETSKIAVQVIKSMPMSDSDREKICHLNAEKLLGL
ncbi:MAG: amidohydrolase family protein [Dehalococcoidia bacterium]|nr:amidohydrolase family protein [Dehalococcoidia bacterium]